MIKTVAEYSLFLSKIAMTENDDGKIDKTVDLPIVYFR